MTPAEFEYNPLTQERWADFERIWCARRLRWLLVHVLPHGCSPYNGVILDHASGLLEGNYPDRRMVYFSNMDDVKSKKSTLEKLVREWVELMDK